MLYIYICIKKFQPKFRNNTLTINTLNIRHYIFRIESLLFYIVFRLVHKVFFYFI